MSVGWPRVLMLFLDGVGIGPADPRRNPFFAAECPILNGLLGGRMPHLSRRRATTSHAVLVPLNATLGVPGLPQSGTGQIALFTGLTAPRLVGKHFGPYPYSSLRSVVAEQNIFRKLDEMKRRCQYANAYPQRYLDHLATHPTRTTATVLAWLSAGMTLNSTSELLNGTALAADVTSERWVRLGYGNVPIQTPREAGGRLVSLLENNEFVLYEYFFTDHAGHSQSMQQATEILSVLDGLLGGIVDAMDHRWMTLLLVSDHGNFEDLSTKTHTRNPVPLFVVGANKEHFASRCKNLTHVTPAILDALI